MFQKKYFENVKTFFRVPIIALRFIDWEKILVNVIVKL